MVLPRALRAQLIDPPGEVVARTTPEGLLLTPALPDGVVEVGADGLPILRLGRTVGNAEVLGAIDAERSGR